VARGTITLGCGSIPPDDDLIRVHLKGQSSQAWQQRRRALTQSQLVPPPALHAFYMI
jgi:hypothetical protein